MEEETDVLIVGAGIAGLTAAVEAADAGAEVKVLEKGAPSFVQTSTAHSGGQFDIFTKPYGPYTPDELYDRFVKTSKGSCDKKLVRILCDRQASDFEWFRNLGMPFMNKSSFHNKVQRGGAAILPNLKRIVEKKGATILFHHKATKLLTSNMGRITSVRAMTPDGLKDFKARAVVLSTGGFEWNGEMMLRYFGPQIYDAVYRHNSAGRSHTGDGALMAMEVGASFLKSLYCLHARLEDKTWIPGVRTTAGPIRALPTISKWGIWINKWGKRFIDETRDHDTISCAAAMQPEGEVALIFDETAREKQPKEAEEYDRLARKFQVTDIIMKFDSIKDLAKKIGVLYKNMQVTIDEFNRAVKDGRALDLEIPKCRFDADLEQKPPEPRACKIEKPPFYVVYPVWATNNTVWGGLDITGNAEVMDRDGKPISGLYACGGLHGGIMYGKWYQTPSGTWTYYGNYHYVADSLPTCLVFGRIAGKNAAALAPAR